MKGNVEVNYIKMVVPKYILHFIKELPFMCGNDIKTDYFDKNVQIANKKTINYRFIF